MEPNTILLTGSYNGQDSLGDECLLKCVVDQYARASGKPLRFVLHTDSNTSVVSTIAAQHDLTANQGLQSVFWRFRNQLRHTHLPSTPRSALAVALFPSYLAALEAAGDPRVRTLVQQIATSKLLHVFGGTNFSKQWFWLNAPYYMATSAALRARGRPTYFGPQQYGPMTQAQASVFKLWLKTSVRDYRARNPRCVELLGGCPETHLTADEVYSNRGLYPIRSQRPRDGRYVLVNLRAGTMLDQRSFEPAALDGIAELLVRLHAELRLPFRFFAVSGAQFVDDARSFECLRARMGDRAPIEYLGRVRDEYELMTHAAGAYGSISMSFHGCILCGFMAIPAIPVTTGAYYDYKYIGFDAYGDGQPVPILSIDDPALPERAGAVLRYFRQFDPVAAAKRREQAARRLEGYYRSIVQREFES